MSVTVRERSTKKGTSLYLDYYFDGKRSSETLGLFIIANPKTREERNRNKEYRQLADEICAKRIIEMKENQNGFKNSTISNASFIEYFKKLMNERKNAKNNYGNWDSTLKHLERFCKGKDILFKDINRDLILKIKTYFDEKAQTKSQLPLSKNSKHSYFNKIKAALREAHEHGYLPENFASQVRSLKSDDPDREYLTQKEVKKLSETSCELAVLKKAFLFGCITGLRHSDIMKLVWSDLRIENGDPSIKFVQKKTNKLEYHPISKQALELLGDEGNRDERIFKGLKYSAWINLKLREWVMRAGIDKKITFHCARHTYAYLQLLHGTDIYTLSNLLGHESLRATLIYAKIVQPKKRDAANRISF